jgi:lysophospholipase L1-like esterase
MTSLGRLKLFRLLTVILMLLALEAISYCAMWYNSQAFDWLSNKNYFRVRAMLIGDRRGAQLPRYLTLPYMGYAPYPGYEKNGVVQHNPAGYRGEKVPLKRSSKLRVLCMGGSTTYGLAVSLPGESYPAQLEKMLNDRISHDAVLSQRYKGAEVINAGLEAGTSAEELSQYLFKYRYYRPDVIVVHSGVNDAEVMNTIGPDFQIDYTHYRRLQFHLEPLPQPAAFLLHSYFISFMVIRLFYENFYYSGTSGRECYTKQRGQTFSHWNEMNMDSVFANHDYRYLPYYRNTKSLFQEIQRDSIALLVLPNILNERDAFVKNNQLYLKRCNENIIMSYSLAQQTGGETIPFTYDSIRDAKWWVDDCHLNAAGEKNKAEIVLPHIIGTVTRK